MEKSKTIIDRSIIESITKEVLSDMMGYDIEDLEDSSLLEDDLGLDSFDALRIIFEVEDRFDITIPPTEVADIKTMEDMYEYIEKRIADTGK